MLYLIILLFFISLFSYLTLGVNLPRTPIYSEVCVASEVFLRKVKFVYDKWSFTKGEVAVEKEYGFLVYSYSYHKLGDLSTTLEMTVLF